MDEMKVMNSLAAAWNGFLQLPQLPASRSGDLNDFKFAIHAAQNIILARIGQRHFDAAYEKHADAVVVSNLGED